MSAVHTGKYTGYKLPVLVVNSVLVTCLFVRVTWFFAIQGEKKKNCSMILNYFWIEKLPFLLKTRFTIVGHWSAVSFPLLSLKIKVQTTTWYFIRTVYNKEAKSECSTSRRAQCTCSLLCTCKKTLHVTRVHAQWHGGGTCTGWLHASTIITTVLWIICGLFT